MSRVRQLIQIYKSPILIITVLLVTIFSLWILAVTITAKNTGFTDKTLWDWMDLLIVPLLLALGLWWLNRSEKESEKSRTKSRNQRSDMEAYIDRMTTLLLEHNLRDSTVTEPARSIARTLTLTVLPNLNEQQKAQILQFLYESSLIDRIPIINVGHCDWKNSDLQRLNLKNCNLQEADFQSANLIKANLFRAMMQKVNLTEADLTGAILIESGLRQAVLRKANLQKAVLRDADLRWVDLDGADLSDTNLQDTDLRRANLRDVQFTNAVLIGTNLQYAQVEMSQLNVARLVKNITLPNGDLFTREEVAVTTLSSAL